MSGAIPPLPQYAFKVWCSVEKSRGTNSIFTFYSNNYETRRKRCKKVILAVLERALLEKLIVTHLVKKFPAFYRTRRFNTVFTRTRH
jgi:hypothetical protein